MTSNPSLEKTANTEQEKWDIDIQPKHGLFDLHLDEVWKYRDLVRLFVRRDFVAAYKQTVFGHLWHFLNPLFTTFMFFLVFHRIAKISTDGLPPILFYMCGNICWGYFAKCFNSTSNTFVANAGIFGKVYFPRLVAPLSNVISSLISFSIQMLMFLCFMAYYLWQGANVHPGWWILAVPILLLIMATLGLGFGVIVSSLTTKYRDLTIFVGFGVTLLMYATPVIYPISSLSPKLQSLMLLNPLAPIIEGFRFAFLGQGIFNLSMLGYSAGVSLVVFIVGIILFNKTEKNFMDTV
ncbi:ABC transporter permease [Flammeovirgaceae bacterium SG7u.111]|nr:ABC transporter permease [Flammeovirgaceae bacterium SG7u.132]WPO34963.1 ABC transporter permease [Flammeovirgaceae bacterium SG7u.111]